MEYANSKLSQLQPEPEREPERGPQVNVLDDETMAELLFQEIDADGSGTLDWGEIDALAKQLGKPLSEAELEAAMQEMDEDGNGTRAVRLLCNVPYISAADPHCVAVASQARLISTNFLPGTNVQLQPATVVTQNKASQLELGQTWSGCDLTTTLNVYLVGLRSETSCERSSTRRLRRNLARPQHHLHRKR